MRKYRLLLIFMLGLIFLFSCKEIQKKQIDSIQMNISSEIIRFHVRANSDSKQDQENKMAVKQAVIEYLQPMLNESKSIDETRKLLNLHMDDIKKISEETLLSLGVKDDVNVYFENCFFPAKTYGDVTFPPGKYEAFRIDIGKSNGKNWWCVLYPPLCFVDVAYGILPEDSKNDLKNVLDEEEYNTITDTQYKFRFKYITFLNKFIE